MLRFNCFLVTVTISFFSLFLFKTEGDIAFKTDTHHHTHDIKIDGLYNTFAISADNSFHELLSFDKQRLTTPHFIYTFTCLKHVFLDEGFNYLKTSHLLDLNLTTRTIIYPFHSFL